MTVSPSEGLGERSAVARRDALCVAVLAKAMRIIAIGRLRIDPKAEAYMQKRIAEAHSILEAIRCLKRYIAREVLTLDSKHRREVNKTQIAT